MFDIYRILFLALKMVGTVKIIPPQILTTLEKKNPPAKFPPSHLMLFGKPCYTVFGYFYVTNN